MSPLRYNTGPNLEGHSTEDENIRPLLHGPLARYVKLRDAHAPGMPRTFSPAMGWRSPHASRHVRHMPGSLICGFLWSRWRGNVPGIPDACANCKFTYLVTGPWRSAGSYSIFTGPAHRTLKWGNITFIALSYWRHSTMSWANPKCDILHNLPSPRKIFLAAKSRCKIWKYQW